MKKGWIIGLCIVALMLMINACDTRTESEKYYDTYNNAVNAYADFHG